MDRDSIVRVRLRYPDLETFLEKFAPNVTRGGIFLASRDPRPVGDVLRFEVLLRQGGPVLSGEGRVTWVKAFNPAQPYRPYGMGVQFIYVDPAARPVLEQLLERKNQRRAATPATGTADGSGFDSRPASNPFVSTPELREEDLDDATMRRALDRARHLSSRTDDLESLLAPEPERQFTRAEALADLPNLLAGRRAPTFFRAEDPRPEKPAPSPSNGGHEPSAPAIVDSGATELVAAPPPNGEPQHAKPEPD